MELLRLILSLDVSVSEEEVHEVIRAIDTDNDDALDMKEYLSLMVTLRSMEGDV